MSQTLHRDKLPLVAVAFGEQVLMPLIPKGTARFLFGGALPTIVYPLTSKAASELDMLADYGVLDEQGHIRLEQVESFLRAGLKANDGEVNLSLADILPGDHALRKLPITSEIGFTFDGSDVDKLLAIAKAANNS